MNTASLSASAQQLFLSPRVWDMGGFALRNWLASILALYVAFALQLESPYWAWLTVWIVAQPTPGMLLSKSLYLVLGTLAGAFFGITLIALFAQTPELFVLALALLVGGCTVASNILTNFRAYGTVLAAYSSGLIASGAIDTPDQVFFIGMARTACILTGIACSILVTSIFAPYRSEAEVRKKMVAVLKDAARRAVFSWGQPKLTVVDSDSFWIVGYFEETKLPHIHEGDYAHIRLMGWGPEIAGHVESISRAIADTNSDSDSRGLANVDPIFTWVRLAQRLPVRIHIDHVPDNVRIAAGQTCTIVLDPGRKP